MKSIYAKLGNYLVPLFQAINNSFIDSFGWLRSLWIYCLGDITRPGIFYGYQSYKWASMYAEKRANKWRSEWDQSGRQQATFPFRDTSLIVCSKMEMKVLKKKGLIDRDVKIKRAIKKSYYTTQLS